MIGGWACLDRPRTAVWSYLIETPKLQQWLNFESMVQVTEGPVEKGTRYEQTMRFLGKRIEMTDEVIEFEDGVQIALRPVKAPISYTVDQRLEAENGGTKVIVEFEASDDQGFFGKLAEPVFARLLEHEIDAQLGRLKALAEADAS